MIHKYKLAGYNIVLDINSGLVCEVDDLTYDILDNIRPPFGEKCPENVIEKLMKFYQKDEIISCYDEVRQLYDENIFFSDDICDFPDTPGELRSVCLAVSAGCGCDPVIMDEKTACAAVDYLIDRSEGTEEPEISFFAGDQPFNTDILEKTVRYARSREKETGKKFIFTVTSGDTSADAPLIDYINSKTDISKSVKGSAAGKICAKYDLSESDLPAIFREYEKLAEKIISEGKKEKDFKYFDPDLDLNRDHSECVRGCGCANESIAVAPDGYIYPCYRFIGTEEFRLGNIRTGITQSDICSRFFESDIRKRSGCPECWAKYYCGGGCSAENYFVNGDILSSVKNSCQTVKKRIECAILIKAVLGE